MDQGLKTWHKDDVNVRADSLSRSLVASGCSSRPAALVPVRWPKFPSNWVRCRVLWCQQWEVVTTFGIGLFWAGEVLGSREGFAGGQSVLKYTVFESRFRCGLAVRRPSFAGR